MNSVDIVINSPTFNTEELQCGSLISIKGHIQLQGFIQNITPKVISLAYYDNEVSDGLNLTIEKIYIEDVVSGKQTIELIRKAIPLEV